MPLKHWRDWGGLAGINAIIDYVNGLTTHVGVIAGASGDVTGPSSATDDRIATFDGTTGKLIQDGGQTIAQVIAAASGSGWTEVIAASDQDISSNTTVQSDSELFFTMAAGGVYAFDAVIAYSSPAGGGTPDFKYQFNGPATLTGAFVNQLQGYNTADALSAISNVALASPATAGTAATPRVLRIFGWASSTGGGSGSSGLLFQWAQNTSNASATRRHAGSILSYRRIL